MSVSVYTSIRMYFHDMHVSAEYCMVIKEDISIH